MRGDQIGICPDCGHLSALPVWWREGMKGQCTNEPCETQRKTEFYPDQNLTLSPHRLGYKISRKVSLEQLNDDFDDLSVPIFERIGYE